ncbi:hypothetical protein A3D66_00965 [Candidatus Kaiserbacteria bacterium RIFCSPHIGHO2_02_FULL_50_9]|uniref:Uncharacterized protein n=1 Tax=Candidatus Kaiserbacteria bacterium RIFCSPLOWO2_01_FULL_51_21 TaxID=1798508 RepID=A0A1F6EDD2_9BACT|nr:MAG: hypothetical protein A3D66_00965 [Candidatus Kaiserbacteria bacterium RIFCSPHIGHO2_02_FULL_50_9]OGG71679.1 MAG: hypothetical protein A3A35_00750 [Candidatus Kaiserbacteria bacterium RIFCSPLOWO2_01_FULL_51_21]
MRIPAVFIVGALLVAPANAHIDPTRQLTDACDEWEEVNFYELEILTLEKLKEFLPEHQTEKLYKVLEEKRRDARRCNSAHEAPPTIRK